MLISVFAAAAYRIIPSVNRLFQSYMQIKTHQYTLDELQDLFKSTQKQIAMEDRIRFSGFLQLKSIGFSYAAREFKLRDIHLNFAKGDRVVIYGESGSGKTTLLYIILGFLENFRGKLQMDEQIFHPKMSYQWRENFAFVSQHPVILDATVEENITLGKIPSNQERGKLKAILKTLKLEAILESGDGLRAMVGENGLKLSGGQKQRLSIARVLFQKKPILILDEFTNNLDAESEQIALNAIEETYGSNHIVIYVTHQPGIIKSASKIIQMKNGAIESYVDNSLNVIS